MKASSVNPELVLYGVIAVAAVYAIYNAKKAAGAVADGVTHVVTKDLNPASDQNVVNRAVTSVGEMLTGDSNWTLGGWIYDITHPSTSVSDIGSVSDIQYDEMGNVISTNVFASPTFSSEQMGRIAGTAGSGAATGGSGAMTNSGGDSQGSFNQISKSNPLDPLSWAYF